MTQKQVAYRLGVVAKTVSKWETGHGFPYVSTLSTLADVLNRDIVFEIIMNVVQNKVSVSLEVKLDKKPREFISPRR